MPIAEKLLQEALALPEDARVDLAEALLENFRNLFRLPVAASGATGKLGES